MNSLAQYLQQYNTGMGDQTMGPGSGFTTFGSPKHAAQLRFQQQYDFANRQRMADADYEGKLSENSLNQQLGSYFGQQPNFYGQQPNLYGQQAAQMPQYVQPKYEAPVNPRNALARMVR